MATLPSELCGFISGGIDWTRLVELMNEILPLMSTQLPLFIVFCILRVHIVMTQARDDQDICTYVIKSVIDVISEIELNSSGDSPSEVFLSRLESERMRSVIKSLMSTLQPQRSAQPCASRRLWYASRPSPKVQGAPR